MDKFGEQIPFKFLDFYIHRFFRRMVFKIFQSFTIDRNEILVLFRILNVFTVGRTFLVQTIELFKEHLQEIAVLHTSIDGKH